MERYSELIELPSQGRLYDGKLPGGEIEIYAMGVEEESMLIGKNNKTEASRALDRLIERCIKTDFPIDELLVSDRFYIFLMIRKISYGSIYDYFVTCPNCGDKVSQHVDIPGSFNVTLLDEGVTEPFYTDLPMCKKRVGFKLLRMKDETDTQMYSRNQRRVSKNSDINHEYLYRIAKHIVSVDDIVDGDLDQKITNISITEALEFVRTLIGRDSSKLKSAIAKNDCGIDLKFDTDCNSCGEEFKTSLEFTAEFFRPESDEV